MARSSVAALALLACVLCGMHSADAMLHGKIMSKEAGPPGLFGAAATGTSNFCFIQLEARGADATEHSFTSDYKKDLSCNECYNFCQSEQASQRCLCGCYSFTWGDSAALQPNDDGSYASFCDGVDPEATAACSFYKYYDAKGTPLDTIEDLTCTECSDRCWMDLHEAAECDYGACQCIARALSPATEWTPYNVNQCPAPSPSPKASPSPSPKASPSPSPQPSPSPSGTTATTLSMANFCDGKAAGDYLSPWDKEQQTYLKCKAGVKAAEIMWCPAGKYLGSKKTCILQGDAQKTKASAGWMCIPGSSFAAKLTTGGDTECFSTDMVTCAKVCNSAATKTTAFKPAAGTKLGGVVCGAMLKKLTGKDGYSQSTSFCAKATTKLGGKMAKDLAWKCFPKRANPARLTSKGGVEWLSKDGTTMLTGCSTTATKTTVYTPYGISPLKPIACELSKLTKAGTACNSVCKSVGCDLGGF